MLRTLPNPLAQAGDAPRTRVRRRQTEKAAFAERMQDSIDRKKAHLEASVQRNVALALVRAPLPRVTNSADKLR